MRTGIESITDFVFMDDEIEKADVILVAGASRPELMYKAIELYEANYSKYILTSGSYNKKLLDNQTESDFLAQIALDRGVPEAHILRETMAKHTFDNAKFSLELLLRKDICITKVILVCKAYHARRAFLTYRTIFPKTTKIIIQPIVDERNITKDNWYLDTESIECVMNEVSKIGEYFSHHIKNLVADK